MQGRPCCCRPHFTNEKTKAQRGWETSSGPHSLATQGTFPQSVSLAVILRTKPFPGGRSGQMKPKACRNEPERDALALSATLRGWEHYRCEGDPFSVPHKHQIDRFQLKKNIKTYNMRKSTWGEMYYPAVTTARESWGLWTMHVELFGSEDPASRPIPGSYHDPHPPEQPSSCHHWAAFWYPALTHAPIFHQFPMQTAPFAPCSPSRTGKGVDEMGVFQTGLLRRVLAF